MSSSCPWFAGYPFLMVATPISIGETRIFEHFKPHMFIFAGFPNWGTPKSSVLIRVSLQKLGQNPSVFLIPSLPAGQGIFTVGPRCHPEQDAWDQRSQDDHLGTDSERFGLFWDLESWGILKNLFNAQIVEVWMIWGAPHLRKPPCWTGNWRNFDTCSSERVARTQQKSTKHMDPPTSSCDRCIMHPSLDLSTHTSASTGLMSEILCKLSWFCPQNHQTPSHGSSWKQQPVYGGWKWFWGRALLRIS